MNALRIIAALAYVITCAACGGGTMTIAFNSDSNWWILFFFGTFALAMLLGLVAAGVLL